MVQSFKKVFSSFVAIMTIVSTVGMGSLSFASVAAAASAGDLIKASGPAVYYYAVDGKRYVFPNEKTYFSWYKDFSSVKTITDAELAAIQIGGNVTTRPGTKLVKITTDPKVYAVTKCGVLHWVESETIAKSLFGDAWATRVVDVPDAFFVNYTIGSSVSTAVHPDGQVVQYSGDSNWYAVMSGTKRKFASQSVFDSNMENSLNAVVTTISYPNGTDITGVDSDLTSVVCATGTSTPPVGGALTVSLASDTPSGATVPKNANSVPLVKFMLAAGSSDVTISSLVIHRVGVGAATDFSNVYLYDQNGKRLTTGRTINSTSHTATFSSLAVKVTAGGTQALYVYGDFSSPSSTGGQHSIEILDAASVGVGSGSTVTGNFPVRGNTYTVGTSSSGRLDVQKGTTPSNPTVGALDAEISNFKLIANTNDIKVNSVTLYQAGSITNSDLSTLKLYQGTTVVAETAAVGTDGHIVLKFTTPFLITNGTTKVFSLHAKVGGRSTRTIRTYVEYTTDVNATDTVYNAGAAVCIATTATGGCTSTSQGSFDGTTSGEYIEVTTQGGVLTNAFNGPATSNVAKGQLAVPLYKFSLTADNTLEVRNIRFAINNTAGTTCYVKGTGTATALDGTNYFRAIKIKNLDTGATIMGPTEMSSTLADASTGSGTITLSDAFNITAGQTLNMAIVADISNSEDVSGELFTNGTCGYKVTLSAFTSTDIRIVDTGEFLATSKIVPNSAVVGNQMTVKSSSLTIALAGSPSSGTVVKKQADVPVVGLVLTSGQQSNILVTSLSLTCQAALASTGIAFGTGTLGTGGDGTTALGNCDSRVTSLSLWNGSTQVGVAKAPDTTTGVAQISNTNLSIPAGSSISLTVKATFGSTASTTSPYDQIAVGVGAAADVTVQDADANTVSPTVNADVISNANGGSPSVKQTVQANGVLTVTADSNASSAIVVSGKDVWVPFAQYKASAQYEDISLDRIAVLASSTAGYTADNAVFTAIAVASGGAVKGQDILSSGASGTKDIVLASNPLSVPKDGAVQFQVWGKLSNIQSSSTVAGATTGVHRSGMQPAVGLNSGLQTGEWDSNYVGSLNVRATGLASGERVYTSSTNATHGNIMVTRRSKPVVSKLALSSTTLANIDQDLLKFQIAPSESDRSIALKQIILTFSKSSSTAGNSALSISNFRLRKGTSEMALADIASSYVSSTGNNVVDVETGSIASGQNSGYVVISFTNEETIVSPGTVYTVHATVANAVTGNSVSLSFLRDSTSRVVTGYLRSNLAYANIASSTSIFVIDTGTAPTSTQNAAEMSGSHATGTLLWSDNSEGGHSASLGASGGSRDWTNDTYVDDVSQTQTLSL